MPLGVALVGVRPEKMAGGVALIMQGTEVSAFEGNVNDRDDWSCAKSWVSPVTTTPLERVASR